MPVLLVDDHRQFAFAVKVMLEASGVPCDVAHSGPEALEKLRGGFRPRIILLDWMMPEMSGREVLTILREEFPGVPVAVVSGFSFEPTADVGQPRVSKPVSREDLLALIEQYGLPEIE